MRLRPLLPSAALALAASLWAALPPAPRPERLPRPGLGVFFRADDLPALRAKVEKPPCRAHYQRFVKQADAGLARWAVDREKHRMAAVAPKPPDLTTEFVPAEHLPEGGRAAGKALEDHAQGAAPAA